MELRRPPERLLVTLPQSGKIIVGIISVPEALLPSSPSLTLPTERCSASPVLMERERFTLGGVYVVTELHY